MSDPIDQFLTPFPAGAKAAVARALAEGASVELPDPGMVEFRRDPATHLRRIGDRLHQLWQAAPAPGRVVWCLSGTVAHGLDEFEVPAVLGRYLHLDLVALTHAGDEKRVVAVGTWREERVALALRAPESMDGAALEQYFTALAAAGPHGSVVFLSAEAAGQASAYSAAVRRYVAGGGAVGLRVPAAAARQVLADPTASLAALADLAGQPIRMVHFDEPPTDPVAFDRFMRQAGLLCDTSMPVDDGAAPIGVMIRRGAYAGASPYRPQPFDLRMPWFHGDSEAWFELPLAPFTAGAMTGWWQQRRGASDDTLASLLDNSKMEAFFRASRIEPAGEEHYPEFRIYNWPAPAPKVRVALLDGGEVTADQAVGLLAGVAASARQAGPRAQLVAMTELLAAAAGEIDTRYAISATRAIAAQNEAHEYLATVPHEAPLRPDYADFARFVAADLGDALELGSGYGVLAWALSLRAHRYTCVDLDRHMFADLRADLGQAGLVADLHQLPFASAAFDSVVANNVLEHLYDPLAGLREVHRTLRPGGHLFALIPFDALNSHHALPAHLWKLDEAGLRQALDVAGFHIARLDVVHLNELGVVGAFPTCHGLAAMFDAVKPGVAAPGPPAVTRRVPASARVAGVPGRLLPVVREAVGFERWQGRRVLAVGSDPTDVAEFAHFGADVVPVDAAAAAWPVADGSIDLVYGFLTLPAAALTATAREIQRVLAAGGTVVAGFRNRDGLRYHARIRSYYGEACDLQLLAGSDSAAFVADDDGPHRDDDYLTAEAVAAAFATFANPVIQVRGLTPEDLPGASLGDRDRRFWTWLSHTYGRFVMLRAEK